MSGSKPTLLGHTLRFFRLFSDLLNVKNVVLLVTLGLIGLSGLLGGWGTATAEHEEIPIIDAGESTAADPFQITALEAFWSDDPGAFGFAGESTFLFLRAHVESGHGEAIPAPVLLDSLTMRVAEELEPEPGMFSNSFTDDGSTGTPVAYRAIDGQSVRGVQPGLGQEYWFMWALPLDTPRDGEVEVQFFSHTWRQSALEDAHIWADRTLVATQVLASPPGAVSTL